MKTRRFQPAAPRVALGLLLCSVTPPSGAEPPAWVAASDAHTAVVTAHFAKYLPEIMGRFGAAGFDQQILQLPLDVDERYRRDGEALLAELRRRLEAETVVPVRQDLEILIDLVASELEESELEERLMVPYLNLPLILFQGFQPLLDEQTPEDRRPAALVRLRRYAGLEEGYSPLTEQAEAYIRSRLGRPELLGPFRGEVEQDLARNPRIVEGLGKLFAAYGPQGWEEPYAALKGQLAAYDDFVRHEVLPRAREDYRLPPELYAVELRNLGVDMPLAEMASRAKTAFREIQNELQALAALIAAERELPSPDYRDVLRELKQEQVTDEEVLAHYTRRIEEVEEIIAREGIVTLPRRPMRLRLANEAEAAVVQAATIRWPQLLGEAAEVGEMILPLTRPASGGAEELRYDDFTFDATTWSLVVHEGRPGHELQMAAMLERGVSKARAAYAMNSVNVEGWALYVEAEMKPYLPLEAQLVSLQHRLLRAARAFLDPGMQSGEISRDEAMRILMDDGVFSEALADQEVERYTVRSPGQATSYFCGYSRLMELRTDVERLLGQAFDRKAYHDFLLSQGLLPPRLMRKAVMEEFVAERLGPAATPG